MNFIKKIVFFILISAISLFCSCIAAKKKEVTKTGSKPNIIFILADDLGYGDLSFLGQQNFSTPNIDKMAQEGLVFTNHYSGCTVCAPSRSALMTGQHTGHTPIRGNKENPPEGQFPLPAATATVAELLSQAGYTTGAFGKWGLGSPGSEGDPNYQGFSRFFGYNCQRLAHNYYPEYLWDNQEKVFLEGNQNRGTKQFSHDEYHNRALGFIKENQNRPFFLFLPYIIPHAELIVPEDSLFDFYKSKIKETKPFAGYDEGPDYRKGPYGSQQYPHAAFASMVSRLDRSVGEILAALKQYGIDKKTLVIFSSDNGPHKEGGADPEFFNSSGPFRGIKRDLYEGGIHVPFIAWWPGTVSPGETGLISAFWDFLPTCAEIAGASLPEKIDGISYLPTLTGNTEGQKQHEYLYWEFHEKNKAKAIRKGNWKAIWFGDGRFELYDLSSDIHEDKNLASGQTELVEEFKTLFGTARDSSEIWN